MVLWVKQQSHLARQPEFDPKYLGKEKIIFRQIVLDLHPWAMCVPVNVSVQSR